MGTNGHNGNGASNGNGAAPDDQVGHKKPPVEHQFKPGQSGNPGGQQKGRVYVSEALHRLLKLSPAEILEHTPINVAEQIAFELVARACGKRADWDPLPAAKEIADRTEGKARQHIKIEQPADADEAVRKAAETLVLLSSQTGSPLTQEQAKEQIKRAQEISNRVM